jgi:hypothetical protein
MAIRATFTVPGMTEAQYDEVMERLDRIGGASPDGRRYHVAHPIEGGWEVVDVWDSPETLERFASESLVPILLEAGIDPPDPRVATIHNVVPG